MAHASLHRCISEAPRGNPVKQWSVFYVNPGKETFELTELETTKLYKGYLSIPF